MRHGTLTSRIIRLGGSKQVIVKYVRISVKMTLFRFNTVDAEHIFTWL
jgi:hypothetical protein